MSTPAARRPKEAPVEHGVPPATARRRARLVMLALLGGLAGLTVGAGLAMRAHPQWDGLLGVPWLCGFLSFMLPMVCQESGPPQFRRVRRDLMLTARTRTGPRTVNLSHLRRVRHVYVTGRFRAALDFLIVTDVHGVRVGITDTESRKVLWWELRTRDRRAGVRISRAAAAELGYAPGVAWRLVLRAYVTLALGFIWAFLVAAATNQIAGA